MRIAQGSKIWIFASFIAGLIFLILTIATTWSTPSSIFLFFTVVVFLKTFVLLLFFRDPDRVIGKGIVACADGRIREIADINDDKIGNSLKISTFMNVYNVHVNRIPLDGDIKFIEHISGIHLPAFKKESDKNERMITTINTKIGPIKIIQIAGTLARRIVPYIKKGDKLKKGERIGIIRFGSRVDVYLPSKKIKKILVKIGEGVKAGETTIAEIND
jgi:phosphatidylserine decarboxylase